MKRMVSLDFIRGLCIIGMVALHAFGRIYDASWLGTDSMGGKSLLHILLLITIAYIGGMAGLFLMVSTISHTISMRDQIKAGKNINKVVARQLMAGFLLLAFAFLAESTIGHHGFLGRMAYFDPLGDASFTSALVDNSARVLYRGYHFMTLHTIAWSVIVNSIVQWFLYRKDGFKRISRNVKVYIGLIVLILVLTPLAWGLADMIVPGYPFATYTGTDLLVQYPLAGISTGLDHLTLFFLGPLAGQTEPLFPFLFISFIGAIIGMYLTMDRPPRYLPHNGMKIGGVMFFAGALGIALLWGLGLDSVGNLVEHTYEILRLPIWMPLLFLTTGGQLVFLMMVFRLVEYRGMALDLARRTVTIRRFAAVSLTIYTFQYLDSVPTFLMSLIPGVDVHGGKEGVFWTVMAVVAILGTWAILLKLWDKKGFRGSAEWSFAVVLRKINGLFTDRRTSKGEWYVVEKLGLVSGQGNVDWLDLRPKKLFGPDRERDSRLALWLSAIGLIIFPVTLLAISVARKAEMEEGRNRFNRLSLRLSRWSLGWGSIATFYLSQTKGFVMG